MLQKQAHMYTCSVSSGLAMLSHVTVCLELFGRTLASLQVAGLLVANGVPAPTRCRAASRISLHSPNAWGF